MIQLRVRETAALSIVEQADYYQEKSGEALAQRWAAAIDEAIRSILQLPQIGSPCHFHTSALADARWISVLGFPRHLIFYRLDEKENTVHIFQVLHGARDIASIFGDEAETE